MSSHLRHATFLAATLALAACGRGGSSNWAGNANTDYSAQRTIAKGPVVSSNVPRVGQRMRDEIFRSNFQGNQVKGLRGSLLLSSAADPMVLRSRSGSSVTMGGTNTTPHINLRSRIPAAPMRAPLTSSLPNVGRRSR